MSATVKHAIKHLSGRVLYEAEIPADMPSGLMTRAALERATEAGAYLAGAYLARAYLARAYLARAYLAGANLARANLAGAYLDGANLAGANLAGANLDGANLAGANLDGAYLARANLARAYLAGAYLARANLAGAYLDGANLAGANLDGGRNLIGERPVLQIGPIGSRCAYFIAHLTDKGVMVRAGCFFGTVAEFARQCAETHGDNQHAREYRAALALIEAHAQLWTPASAGAGVLPLGDVL